MTSGAAQSGQNDLVQRLRDVQVGVRADLETSRHRFRGESQYVILDPITFQTHALRQIEYDLLVRIREDRPLSVVFHGAVEDGLLDETQEADFYEFVLQLHQFGFLSLPIVNDQALYQRFEKKRQRSRHELLFAFISYRLPLINPDRFLDRTMRLVRPVFSPWFFAIWCAIVIAAVACVLQQRAEFVAALPDLIEVRNLLSMWVVLVALKVLHEFGHAFACKNYGGKVPEMGAFFILMTPCAYVNANAAWEFPSKIHRIVVGVAGMYFESVVAAIAAFIWISTDPSLLHSVAFQTMVVASITTIGFNVNPLMRFDGYYIFSDILGIPNLRARATAHVNERVIGALIGTRTNTSDMSARLQATLLLYGIAAVIYRFFLMFSISVILILKFSFVGLAMAGLYIGMQVMQLVRNVTAFFRRDGHSAMVRLRAAALCLILIVGVPASLLVIPLPRHFVLEGTVEPEVLHVMSASVPGVLKEVSVNPGAMVSADDLVVELENSDMEEALIEAGAELQLADLKHRSAIASRSVDAFSLWEEAQYRKKIVNARTRDQQELQIRSDQSGMILDCVRLEDVGRFLEPGESIALIGSGRTLAKLDLPETDVVLIDPEVGDIVEYRLAFDHDVIRTAQVVGLSRITSADDDTGDDYRIAPDPGGDPRESEVPTRPRYELTLLLEEDASLLRYTGGSVFVRIPARSESVATRVYRRALLFINRIQSG